MDSIKLEYSKSGCFGLLLRILGIKPKDEIVEPSPYRLRDDFLSDAEHSFYQVIRLMMGDYFVICPKVNLADLVYVINLRENFSSRNRIDRKHIDFLICERKTIKPKFAIELDDSSHKRKDRSERDTFVDEVFAQAGLPLVRIKASLAYNQQELGAIFKSALTQNAPKAIQDSEDLYMPEANDPPPYCPRCGQPMVLREAKRGPKRGEKFYGCVNYPRCKEVLPLG